MIKYYYIDDISKLQFGPFTPNELARKKIHPDTMVWRSGMADWLEAGTMPELNYLFNSKVPTPQEKEKEQQEKEQPQPTGYSQQPHPLNRQNIQNRPHNPDNLDGILPMPKNWLVESILLTLFCCSPISMVGIFYASNVETFFRNKDYERSLEASTKAKQWTLAGIFFLPAIFVFFTFIGFLL